MPLNRTRHRCSLCREIAACNNVPTLVTAKVNRSMAGQRDTAYCVAYRCCCIGNIDYCIHYVHRCLQLHMHYEFLLLKLISCTNKTAHGPSILSLATATAWGFSFANKLSTQAITTVPVHMCLHNFFEGMQRNAGSNAIHMPTAYSVPCALPRGM